MISDIAAGDIVTFFDKTTGMVMDLKINEIHASIDARTGRSTIVFCFDPNTHRSTPMKIGYGHSLSSVKSLFMSVMRDDVIIM